LAYTCPASQKATELWVVWEKKIYSHLTCTAVRTSFCNPLVDANYSYSDAINT